MVNDKVKPRYGRKDIDKFVGMINLGGRRKIKEADKIVDEYMAGLLR